MAPAIPARSGRRRVGTGVFKPVFIKIRIIWLRDFARPKALAIETWRRRVWLVNGRPRAWGSAAASILLDEAKRISPQGIALDVNRSNARAVKFYEREGFVRTGEGKNEISGKPTFRYIWKP